MYKGIIPLTHLLRLRRWRIHPGVNFALAWLAPGPVRISSFFVSFYRISNFWKLSPLPWSISVCTVNDDRLKGISFLSQRICHSNHRLSVHQTRRYNFHLDSHVDRYTIFTTGPNFKILKWIEPWTIAQNDTHLLNSLLLLLLLLLWKLVANVRKLW